MTHKANSGEQIDIRFNNLMSIKIMLVECNFNVYQHAYLGYVSLCGVCGVKALIGINASKKDKGQYSFLIEKKIPESEIQNEIIEEFNNYFIQF